jgi:hypothetical protein
LHGSGNEKRPALSEGREECAMARVMPLNSLRFVTHALAVVPHKQLLKTRRSSPLKL